MVKAGWEVDVADCAGAELEGDPQPMTTTSEQTRTDVKIKRMGKPVGTTVGRGRISEMRGLGDGGIEYSYEGMGKKIAGGVYYRRLPDRT
jgi:hypothetical protein